MADSTTSPGNDSHLRNNFFLVGCLANLLLFALLIVLCVVFFVAIGRTLETSAPEFDDRVVRRVLDDQAAAWNRGDLDGFMEGYWHDDRLSFTSHDQVTHGWESTRERYIKRYKSDVRGMGKLSFFDLDIESLSPTVALVRGRYKLVRLGREDTGRFTLVFRKFADGWKITSDHTSAAEKSG